VSGFGANSGRILVCKKEWLMAFCFFREADSFNKSIKGYGNKPPRLMPAVSF
jgi:hypothetical protein